MKKRLNLCILSNSVIENFIFSYNIKQLNIWAVI